MKEEKEVNSQENNSPSINDTTEVKETAYERVVREYDELWEKMEESGATQNTYDPDANLTISGKDFANMVNYCVSVENVIASMESYVESNKKALDSYSKNLEEMKLFNASMGVALLKQHNDYFNNGNTITQEQADVIYAKEKVKPVDE